jgi:hypothetical protein
MNCLNSKWNSVGSRLNNSVCPFPPNASPLVNKLVMSMAVNENQIQPRENHGIFKETIELYLSVNRQEDVYMNPTQRY